MTGPVLVHIREVPPPLVPRVHAKFALDLVHHANLLPVILVLEGVTLPVARSDPVTQCVVVAPDSGPDARPSDVGTSEGARSVRLRLRGSVRGGDGAVEGGLVRGLGGVEGGCAVNLVGLEVAKKSAAGGRGVGKVDRVVATG